MSVKVYITRFDTDTGGQVTKVHNYEDNSQSALKAKLVMTSLLTILAATALIYSATHPVGPILHSFHIPIVGQLLQVRLDITLPLLISAAGTVLCVSTLALCILKRLPTKDIVLDEKQTFELEHSQWKAKIGSILRLGYELLCAPCNFSRTRRDSTLTVEGISKHQEVEREDLKETEDGFTVVEKGELDFSSIIEQLRHKRQLNHAVIEHVCMQLGKTKDNFVLAMNFATDEGSAILPEREGRDLVFIPVVLKGRYEHIVAVVYDANKNQVELYDPKGLTSNDHGDRALRSKEKINLAQILRLVALKYGNKDTTLVENTEKHQYDSYNCGVYVSKYFQNRANGLPPGEANKGYSYQNADTLRNELVSLLSKQL